MISSIMFSFISTVSASFTPGLSEPDVPEGGDSTDSKFSLVLDRHSVLCGYIHLLETDSYHRKASKNNEAELVILSDAQPTDLVGAPDGHKTASCLE